MSDVYKRQTLMHQDRHSHVMEYLRESSWQVTGSPRDELLRHFGLAVPTTEDDDVLGEIVYVSARLAT